MYTNTTDKMNQSYNTIYQNFKNERIGRDTLSTKPATFHSSNVIQLLMDLQQQHWLSPRSLLRSCSLQLRQLVPA